MKLAVRRGDPDYQNDWGVDIQRSFSFPYRCHLALFKKDKPCLIALEINADYLPFFPRVRADMGLIYKFNLNFQLYSHSLGFYLPTCVFFVLQQNLQHTSSGPPFPLFSSFVSTSPPFPFSRNV